MRGLALTGRGPWAVGLGTDQKAVAKKQKRVGSRMQGRAPWPAVGRGPWAVTLQEKDKGIVGV